VQDYISNYSFIASRDTVIHGMNLRPGMQISYPINLDGYWNARSLVTYSLPARLIKSNINLNTGFNYGRTPGVSTSSPTWPTIIPSARELFKQPYR